MPSRIAPSTRNRLLGLGLLALCGVSIASPGRWQQGLRGSAVAAAAPALGIVADARDALVRAIARIRALVNTADELERLRQENRALREALAAQADQTRNAAARLRDFKGFDAFRQTSLDRPLRIIPASVIGADPSPWRHTVIIDRGSRDGVRLGSPAVSGASVVGTVVALRPAAATVRLVTDTWAGLKVRVARTGDVGLLRGVSEPEGLLPLKWVHLHPAEPGDMVVTSGQDPAIPPGLVAGEVISASKSRTPHFYDVKVRPLLDLDQLSELLVVVYATGDVKGLLEEETQPAR